MRFTILAPKCHTGPEEIQENAKIMTVHQYQQNISQLSQDLTVRSLHIPVPYRCCQTDQPPKFQERGQYSLCVHWFLSSVVMVAALELNCSSYFFSAVSVPRSTVISYRKELQYIHSTQILHNHYLFSLSFSLFHFLFLSLPFFFSLSIHSLYFISGVVLRYDCPGPL